MKYEWSCVVESYQSVSLVNRLTRLPLSLLLLYEVSCVDQRGLVADVGLRLLDAIRDASWWWLLQRLGADDEV